MITFVCCLWGEWPEPGWGKDYVARLSRAVARNYSEEYQFICFADDPDKVPEGVEYRPLKSPTWKGCLPKVYVYSPEAGLQGRVILLDLDNVIVGDLTPLTEYTGDLAVRGKFVSATPVADGDMISFYAGSTTAQHLWKTLSEDVLGVEQRTGGRERWFIRANACPDLWQDVLGPDKILSYKRHLRRKADLPEEAIIVSFHDGGGKTVPKHRPHQLDIPWLEEHWT